MFLALFVITALTGCMALKLRSLGASPEDVRSVVLVLSAMLPPGHGEIQAHDAHAAAHPPTHDHAHQGHDNAGAEPDTGHHGVQAIPLRTVFPESGWVHGFKAELVDAAGGKLPDEILHHLKIMAPERRELFSPLMLRIVGAGSETGALSLPLNVGIPVSAGDSLLVTAMLHNPTDEPEGEVRLRIRLDYTPQGSWTPPADVIPFFTHVTPPMEETFYDIPPGRSERSIEVRPAVSGTVLGLGGHLHRYGVSVRLEDASTGRVLWRTTARQAPDGNVIEVPHSVMVRSGGIRLEAGRGYRVTAVYENPTGDVIVEGGMGTLGGIFMPDGAWPAVDRTDPVYQWDLARELAGGGEAVPPEHEPH